MLKYIYIILTLNKIIYNNFRRFYFMKKKFMFMITACSVLLSSVSAFAAAENIVINGENIAIPADMGTIREMDNRTFVPVRFVAEELGCVVNYQPTTYTTQIGGVTSEEVREIVTFSNTEKETSYFLAIGDNKLFVLTGTEASIVQMDTVSFLGDDDRTYVPIRFLAEALGYTVDWDEAAQTVSLTSK